MAPAPCAVTRRASLSHARALLLDPRRRRSCSEVGRELSVPGASSRCAREGRRPGATQRFSRASSGVLPRSFRGACDRRTPWPLATASPTRPAPPTASCPGARARPPAMPSALRKRRPSLPASTRCSGKVSAAAGGGAPTNASRDAEAHCDVSRAQAWRAWPSPGP